MNSTIQEKYLLWFTYLIIYYYYFFVVVQLANTNLVLNANKESFLSVSVNCQIYDRIKFVRFIVF
jgi:hypothetical protein